MESMFLLIPLSVGLVLLILGVFGWAVHRGQFDDLDDEAARILLPDDATFVANDAAAVDADQGPLAQTPKESRDANKART